ncbi:hypothetical protein AXG93_2015s1000 [Marchantia polymorpha subsp. ruderalis]|uniref:Uncharacterized protein n=1 Tax=Marchantia polymorpha subsp. ruderalis TaxID=1480154 RepID=A0A176W2S9_MARPO|nr:hypothetical protein AXG93_2015s1000 [Marchantia polymorpha subsp. ruderalis]
MRAKVVTLHTEKLVGDGICVKMVDDVADVKPTANSSGVYNYSADRESTYPQKRSEVKCYTEELHFRPDLIAVSSLID